MRGGDRETEKEMEDERETEREGELERKRERAREAHQFIPSGMSDALSAVTLAHSAGIHGNPGMCRQAGRQAGGAGEMAAVTALELNMFSSPPSITTSQRENERERERGKGREAERESPGEPNAH